MTGPRPAPLRPLRASEILDGAVRLVRGNLPAVLTIAVPFAVVRTGAGALLQYATLESDGAPSVLLGELLLATGLGVVLTGLLAPLFGADLLGSRTTARASLAQVGRRGWALAGLAVVVTLAEGAGLALLVVGGVWLWGIWAVAAPVLALERTGVRGALRRSTGLVKGSFWRVWGVRALGWVLTTVLAFLVTLPFDALAAYVGSVDLFADSGGVANPALFVTITAVGALIAAAFIAPITAAIDVLLYTDLRMRREGMDLVLALPAPPVATGTGATW